MYLSSRRDGEKPSVQAPTEFSLMKYRQQFGITWQQLMDTPWEVISQDFEMLEIEQEVLQSKNT